MDNISTPDGASGAEKKMVPASKQTSEKPCSDIPLGSWNVKTLTQKGEAGERKMEEVREQLTSRHIFALQETHLPLQRTNKLQLDVDGFDRWQFDIEPVNGNCDVGGLMVYLHSKKLGYQFAGLRQLPRKAKETDPNNDKAGLQYQHFSVTRPISFHLINIYDPASEEQNLVPLFKFFLRDLSLSNVVFVGDFNRDRQHNEITQSEEELNLSFYINGNTCFMKRGEKLKISQTDHIASVILSHPLFRLAIIKAEILPLDRKQPIEKQLSDHDLIRCSVVDDSAPQTAQTLTISQPVWSPGDHVVDSQEWLTSEGRRGQSVVAFFFTPQQNVDHDSLTTNLVRVYATENNRETICLGVAKKTADVIPLFDKFKTIFPKLRKTAPGEVTQRCTLIHISKTDDSPNLLAKVIDEGSSHLSKRFEQFASRYYVCDETYADCRKIFLTENDLFDHASSEHKLRPFACECNCTRQFYKEELYWKHLSMAHKNASLCKFSQCSQILFSENRELHNLPRFSENRELHTLLVHVRFLCKDNKCKGLKFKHTEQSHFCEDCRRSDRKFLASHMQIQQHKKQTHPKPFFCGPLCCPKCDKVCKKEQTFREHLQKCLSNKPFRCNICGREYELETLYRRHVAYHKGNKHSLCENCGKEYTSEDMYKKHTEHCGNVKQHVCDKCGKKYKTEYWYNKHITHCGKGYIVEGWYNKHIAHCGKPKPYVCKGCGAQYSKKGWYNRHIALCKGAKQYVCSLCGKGYDIEVWYNKHIAHCGTTKPYVCESCGKGYIEEGWYNRHIAQCRKTNPHVCGNCERWYMTEDVYKWHTEQCCASN